MFPPPRTTDDDMRDAREARMAAAPVDLLAVLFAGCPTDPESDTRPDCGETPCECGDPYADPASAVGPDPAPSDE
jgi:hypothetical protein